MATRDNKFARRAKERAKNTKTAARDAQPTPDEQLTRLEEDIRRLKVEFDIYFNGAAKRPPYDTKGRVDTLIKRLADDRTLSFAQRYRYNTLVARHTSFLQLWRRTMQGREEGRDAASAARAAARDSHADVTSAAERDARQSFVCADPHKDVATIKKIYETFVEAKRGCGESVEELSFPRFHRMIASKADALKERSGCERVQFSVEVKEGRVSFRAKAGK
ncbi:MAG TPA: MXAN_5187 C-terminal domain-containing protein [Pyrinomonadaceae bacterium]|nr:MXAN_5187 C-terminal domain-containing protein [Pyrinomonadaceae bacterium]